MSRLLAYLLWCSLLLALAAPAQRRRSRGQALVVPPSRARYQRSVVQQPGRRAQYRYAPSFHAYYNRRPYQPHIYYHRRAPKRAPVAPLRPRLAGH